MPKVSVIIPTYNRQKVVGESVQSVLNQTKRDLEVIVVDDGSMDNTREVVEALADARVNYFYKTNGGTGSARNFGLSRARGEYIAFLDSDDLWPVNYLEVMVSHLEQQKEYGLTYCSIGYFSSDCDRVKVHFKPEDCKSGWITVAFFKKEFVSPVATVLRRKVIEKFYFDESLPNAQDYDFFLRLSLRTRFLYIPDLLVRTRETPGSRGRSVGTNCSQALSLERFYLRLGGGKIVPGITARKKISRLYRRVAEARRREGKKCAAITLYKRAVRYFPFDLRLYIGFLKALCLNSRKDPQPDWKMPPPLGDPIVDDGFS
jgi:glycosyltransferase involved in cell wall biosynthesis